MHSHIDLNGTWKVSWTDGQRGVKAEYARRDVVDTGKYLDAAVPGEIHLDLWRQGIIADPYVGANGLACRWVEEMFWNYRRTFVAPPEARAAGARAWLVFEQLDLVANIVLNGQEIGKHANVFCPCRVEVTGKLREGENVLVVHLESGLYDVSDRLGEGYHNSPDQRLHKRHWLRKPQCQFEWDWSQRLINVGITGGVRLEWTCDAVRADRLVPLVTVAEDLRSARVAARLHVTGLGGEAVLGRLAVEVVETGLRAECDVTVSPGEGFVQCEFTVADPPLWWPVGHGDQPLQTLRATLEIGGREVATRTTRLAFRRVVVNQRPHPVDGRYFVIEVNNRPIFAKGGNFVPADQIFFRCDRARYETLVDRALEANFNMLRVWGGGLYESDEFYDVCDRRGVMVWQEFIFACGRYPTTDPAFHDSVRAEARYNVRRLACHPSLVIWCGNNEMEWGNWEWGYDRQGVVMPDYALFHLTLPRILSQEDPTRFYLPSSPFSPDGRTPNDFHAGDQHPWGVGMWNPNFRDYRTFDCRFPNEGGWLGPVSLPTLRACFGGGEERVGNFAWQVHDNAVDSWGEPSLPRTQMEHWLGKDERELSVEEFTFRGGLLQGEALREYCDNFRRRMFDSASAIFWMYNDTWPATRSWTIVDYYLRRTPAFWAVRRAMQPVSVVLAAEGDEVIVFGVNDTPVPVRARLQYGVFALAGGWPMDRSADVTLAANASTKLATFPAAEWTDRTATMAFAILRPEGQAGQGGPVIARNKLFDPLLKDLRWPRPQVNVRVENGTAVFSSPTYVWGVCLDLDGEHPMPDNLFDLFPGMEYTIPWNSTTPPKVLWTGNL